MGAVAQQAFDKALADGFDNHAAFDAVANAIYDATLENGVPSEIIEAGHQAARKAFAQAIEGGADAQTAVMRTNIMAMILAELAAIRIQRVRQAH